MNSPIPASNGGTGSEFVEFKGATAPRTYTVPDVNCTVANADGTNANGTWSIDILGNANTATTATNSNSVTGTFTSYTPTIGDGTNSFVTSLASGFYLDLGTVIFVNGRITWTGKGSAVAGSAVRVTLPTTINAIKNNSVSINIGNSTGISFTNVTLQGLATTGNDFFNLHSASTIGTKTIINVSGASASGDIQFNCFYFK
jgi:hypothetical protein